MIDRNALLVLEDGRWFEGLAVGSSGDALGEVVFNTSMTGYQEILTDPSYCGQIVCFTAPQIGNYGVCPDDIQANRPALSGLVVQELSPVASNWRATGTLDKWLCDHRVVGIEAVDTRALTRHLRERGAMRAGIFTKLDATPEKLVERVLASPPMEGRNLACEVSAEKSYPLRAEGGTRHRVVVIDFGVKRSILSHLCQRGLQLDVVPATTTAEEVLDLRPDGVVLSNGPGDPAAVTCGIETARGLLGRMPVLGICLGHQIMALALGARTFKLRFGHHGGNHPVSDGPTGQVWITAQNHGFAVDPDSLPKDRVRVTHHSLYDGTLEGFEAPDLRAVAVQFHPEGAPGPTDAQPVFDRFSALLDAERPDKKENS
jgi:carbamoyl-phosphate synthase small subunit